MQYKEITYSKNIIIKNQANKQTNAKRKNCKKQNKQNKKTYHWNTRKYKLLQKFYYYH